MAVKALRIARLQVKGEHAAVVVGGETSVEYACRIK